MSWLSLELRCVTFAFSTVARWSNLKSLQVYKIFFLPTFVSDSHKSLFFLEGPFGMVVSVKIPADPQLPVCSVTTTSSTLKVPSVPFLFHCDGVIATWLSDWLTAYQKEMACGCMTFWPDWFFLVPTGCATIFFFICSCISSEFLSLKFIFESAVRYAFSKHILWTYCTLSYVEAGLYTGSTSLCGVFI